MGRVPVFSSVSSGRHCSRSHCYTNSPASIVSVRVSRIHTQGYLFFQRVESQCQVKASIGRTRKGRECGFGARITRPPLYPANLEVNREGWSFKQSAPSFIIHATALKISFRNTISSLLSLSLLSFFFFPDRTSIKYE